MVGWGINSLQLKFLTTPFTSFAAAEAITHCGGALTLIAGSLPLTQTKLNPELQPRLVPSFPFIYSDNLLKWMLFLKLSKKYNLKIIEDCAQALLSKD